VASRLTIHVTIVRKQTIAVRSIKNSTGRQDIRTIATKGPILNHKKQWKDIN